LTIATVSHVPDNPAGPVNLMDGGQGGFCPFELSSAGLRAISGSDVRIADAWLGLADGKEEI